MSRRLVRAAGIAVGVLGAVLAVASVVEGVIAKTAAQAFVMVLPECAGLLLIVVGLHAWIDWR